MIFDGVVATPSPFVATTVSQLAAQRAEQELELAGVRETWPLRYLTPGIDESSLAVVTAEHLEEIGVVPTDGGAEHESRWRTIAAHAGLDLSEFVLVQPSSVDTLAPEVCGGLAAPVGARRLLLLLIDNTSAPVVARLLYDEEGRPSFAVPLSEENGPLTHQWEMGPQTGVNLVVETLGAAQ